LWNFVLEELQKLLAIDLLVMLFGKVGKIVKAISCPPSELAQLPGLFAILQRLSG
jgi:hypothetical protein